MRLKFLKLVLRISGALLLLVGGFKQTLEALGAWQALHSNAATVTVMVPFAWLYVAAVGFVLLVSSFFLPRQR